MYLINQVTQDPPATNFFNHVNQAGKGSQLRGSDLPGDLGVIEIFD